MFQSKSFIFCLTFMTAVLFSGCSFYYSEFDGLGSFLSEADGGTFAAAKQQKNTALMYVYRPTSDWAMDEIEAPSFYMNDDRLFGIKGGSYTYYYLQPGEYSIVLRRPLLGLEGIAGLNWHKMASIALSVKAGETYYFRYSELTHIKLQANEAILPEGDGPLKRVHARVALNEMQQVQLLAHKGETLKPLEKDAGTSWWPF